MRIKSDETKPPKPVTVSYTVLHYNYQYIGYSTKPLKVILKLLLRYTSWLTSYKNLFSPNMVIATFIITIAISPSIL